MKNRLELGLGITLLTLVFTGLVLGQNDSPASNPKEVPEVVSRDSTSNVEKPVARKPVISARIPTTGNVPDRSTDEIALPRSVNSPYQITLSIAQQKMMLYLDLLTKTETRAESLRSKLFEIIEKENTALARIRQVDFSLRPEQIQNAAALSGSLRPERVRTDRRKVLEAEKGNHEALLSQIQVSRRNLEAAVISADRLVSRVRARFESFVDAALSEGDEF